MSRHIRAVVRKTWFNKVQFRARLLLWGVLPGASAYRLVSAPDATAHPAVGANEFIYDQAPFPQCHASTIVEMRDGTLLTAFFDRQDLEGVG